MKPVKPKPDKTPQKATKKAATMPEQFKMLRDVHTPQAYFPQGSIAHADVLAVYAPYLLSIGAIAPFAAPAVIKASPATQTQTQTQKKAI